MYLGHRRIPSILRSGRHIGVVHLLSVNICEAVRVSMALSRLHPEQRENCPCVSKQQISLDKEESLMAVLVEELLELVSHAKKPKNYYFVLIFCIKSAET